MMPQNKRGFTLIEVLLALGFIAGLAMLTFITFSKMKAKEQILTTERQEQESALLQMQERKLTEKANDIQEGSFDEIKPTPITATQTSPLGPAAIQEHKLWNGKASSPQTSRDKDAVPSEPDPMSPANVALIETITLFGFLLAGLGIFARRLIKKAALGKMPALGRE